MTKSRVIVVPVAITGFAPDRFWFSYDGESMAYSEQFDDIPEEALRSTLQLAQEIGTQFDIQVETMEKGLRMVGKMPIRTALAMFIMELLHQAAVHELVDLDTAASLMCRMKGKSEKQ